MINKITHSEEQGVETLVIEYANNWWRRLWRLPLKETYMSPAWPWPLWYKHLDNGDFSPCEISFGTNRKIRRLSEQAKGIKTLQNTLIP